MDYKRLIQSREIRIKLLSLLRWVPDCIMIPLQYRIHTGRYLNVRNPRRFTEKLQLYKLRYRNPLMLRCTDKYEARKVVEEMGLGGILVPLIGVYNSIAEIDYDNLPKQFVAKATDGGGSNQVLICRDKTLLSKDAFCSRLNEWMCAPKSKPAGREWAYENNFPRRIIIEQFLSDNKHKDIPDYKFFCFNGKVHFIYGIDIREVGVSANVGIYTPEFNKLDISRKDESLQQYAMPRPINYERMLNVAEHLSSPFPHVRIDLYNIDGNIYFGEFTFYDGSGYMSFTPDSFDFDAGDCFDISSFF